MSTKATPRRWLPLALYYRSIDIALNQCTILYYPPAALSTDTPNPARLMMHTLLQTQNDAQQEH